MSNEIFNEKKLREEIIKTWGEHGAHIEVYDSLLKKVTEDSRGSMSNEEILNSIVKDFEERIKIYPQSKPQVEFIGKVCFTNEDNITKVMQAAREDERKNGWQTCPHCKGCGRELIGKYPISTLCSACNGKKIISIATGKPPGE